MFTGIIECVGRIAAVEPRGGDCRMRIAAPDYLSGVRIGDSIATSGVCLTAIEIADGTYVADLSAETLSLTTAGSWQVGRAVNLERALTPDKPLGGHLVTGHVDGVGHLLEKTEDARSWRLEFEAPQELARYIARKGSVCVDGVSLTVNAVSGVRFGINIVPHTAAHTTLGELKPGDAVNLEVDLIARYLERLLSSREEA
ncbi:riboflavin synthase [Sinimarinibacterium sp. CAU 1509]|uniref:riboflavin synthase n=1 Tax=Sinimarinibacterium sp. CAU 1509 TaxID=2562283 RepID=UPI0010ACCD43|nr:riboflavin synthase [Sinimarinibacterium sp. CAU 1509]TJY60874.1 riboflavin synthase [Sinimarinibacterium sp. CAU 1509]